MYLVFEVFQDTWRSNKENPSVYWGATLSCPLLASNLYKFVSCSDLVLISFLAADHALDFSYLALQACISFCRVSDKSGTLLFWGVAKGSSVSWVAKFKGDENSECKLSNGWSRSYREIKPLRSAGNEWSRSCKEINRHPSLPWNFITHGFLDPSAFPDVFALFAKNAVSGPKKP